MQNNKNILEINEYFQEYGAYKYNDAWDKDIINFFYSKTKRSPKTKIAQTVKKDIRKGLFKNYNLVIPQNNGNEVSKDSLFEVCSTLNMHGGNKETITIKNKRYSPNLTNAEKEILDHVINITAPKYWNTFMELVYSTYPIKNSNRYDVLDLLSFAQSYELEKEFA